MNDVDAASLRQCWDNAFGCYGTAAIFEARANRLRPRRVALAFLGFVVPVSVGGVVMAVGLKEAWLPIVLGFAGIAGLCQLVMSAWAVTNNWEDSYYYSQHAAAVNYDLAAQFESLARTPAENPGDVVDQWKTLDAIARHQGTFDNRQNISQEEKCRGMRVALRKYERACARCKIVPGSLEPTNCPVCGRFR